jgi:hypothetical protein
MEVSSQLRAPAALSLVRSLGAHCIDSWVGPKASLHAVDKISISCTYRESNRDSSSYPASSIVIILTELFENCLQTCMTYTIAECTGNSSWWWTEELSETCRVSFPRSVWEIGASSWFYYKEMSYSVPLSVMHSNSFPCDGMWTHGVVFRLAHGLRCSWGLRSSEMLHSLCW